MTDPIIVPRPKPDPGYDPADDHQTPLDNPEDAKWLDPDDPRRKAIESGQPESPEAA